MRFNLNDLKSYRALKSRSENVKGIFLTQNNFETPLPFRLKSYQNAEISHTNHITPKFFEGTF